MCMVVIRWTVWQLHSCWKLYCAKCSTKT